MPRRQKLRLPYHDYTTPGAYFVTLVTRLRAPLFGYINQNQVIPNEAGKIAVQEWFNLSSRIAGLTLDSFILMPNHLHGVLWLGENITFSLPRIIGLYKAGVSRRCEQKIWQFNFFERVIRDERELYP